MPIHWNQVEPLLVAMLVGAIIGAEREYRTKSAGFRTMMLISMGACLYTMLSPLIGGAMAPERIASNIVVGIGFVGAGVIFKGHDHTHGLTTAASIWVTAALGMAAGAGHARLALFATLLVFVVMALLPALERRIDRVNLQRTYRITIQLNNGDAQHLAHLFKQCRLRHSVHAQHRHDGVVETSWYVDGPASRHEQLVKLLLHDAQVFSFSY
ncbi:MAG: MgtC/SapB family protein [Chitinophagaceae bacterium]|jgi:putative Mg2+ transporter-C (MgtC) family protein|nr:MgtC/SapB family protein [Chitinophagaceae bacterium]